MLTLHINEADMQRLKYERYSYPCPIIQRRLHVLFLKASTNLSHGMISQIVGVHRDKSELEKHSASLLSNFEDSPPHTIAEAVQRIKDLTGIQRSPTQIRAWMCRHNLKYRKTGQIPAKANKEKQQQFVEQTLHPLIEQAQREEIHLLFMDAAHFVMGVFLCFLWSLKRIFVKSSSGRKRYNVLGAVNAINKQVHIWTNESYINSESIVDFFHQLRIYYYDMKPIHIVLDNARYQKCQLVKYIAWQFNIHLVYLPSYSPNLNIIERLWKWVKKKALYATYYDSFDDFKIAINETIDKANKDSKNEIETLLNLKFQLF